MFGERLKELRMASGLSQSALASKLFISQQAVAGWELNKGSPNPETLVKISDILNVSVDYLVGRITEEKKPTPVTEDGLSPLDQRLNELLAKESDETKQAMIDFLEKFRKP